MTVKSHIRTYPMFPSESVAAGPAGVVVGGIEDFIAQEDLRIIGFELGIEPEVPDINMNADGGYSILLELTPNSLIQKPGTLGQCWMYSGWTAALVMTTAEGAKLHIMFPSGIGYDMDEGESLHLIRRAELNAMALSVSIFYKCILYYIRR